MAVGSDFLNEFSHHLEAVFLVRHFAAAEAQRDLDFHLLAEEVDGMAQFNPEIVRIDRRAELDFLDLVGVLVLFGFLFLL